MSEPPRHAIVPIDRCYELVGMIKSRWEGISGGRAIDDAVAEFFAALERAARRELARAKPRCVPVGGGTPATITPEFAVLGVEVVEDAVAPDPALPARRLRADSEREIFTIALTAQINVEPARRDHDAATRERLVDLFGEPERWPATTHPFLWAHATTLVPTFTRRGRCSRCPCRRTFDLEIAAARYFASLAGRRGAARVPFQRLDPDARRRRARPGRLGAVVVLPPHGACRSRPGAR